MRRSMLGLAAAWLALPAATSDAAPMRGGAMRGGLAAQGSTSFEAGPMLPGTWNSFLAGGESTWALRQPPPFTLPVRLALISLVGGDPAVAAASPLVEYFVWRRNLNPGRFDRFHPFIGPRLPQELRPPTPPVTPPIVPPIPIVPPAPPPIPSVPPVIPEPPALLVIAVGAAGALALRRRFGA